jgi:hypothetical protein
LYGTETTVEVLPRLCKIKYDSGIVDELLFVDISNEYQLSSGLMVLEYGKAIQESIFEHLRVVREGQLRIIFSPELKVCMRFATQIYICLHMFSQSLVSFKSSYI